MSIDSVVERIIADAEEQANATLASAKRKAEEIVAEANARVQRDREGTESETAAKVKALTDGKIAQARLDGAKELLKEKRRVIDSVYERAQAGLVKLPEKEALKLAQRLLEEYAEEGDEICFSPDFAYAKQVSATDEVKRKKLKVKLNDGQVNGGFVLRGKTADKDVSFAALIEADKEQNQARLAAEIFNA